MQMLLELKQLRLGYDAESLLLIMLVFMDGPLELGPLHNLPLELDRHVFEAQEVEQNLREGFRVWGLGFRV